MQLEAEQPGRRKRSALFLPKFSAKGFEIKQIINTSINEDLENILNEIEAKTNIIIKDRDKKRKESADDIHNAFDDEADMTDTFE